MGKKRRSVKSLAFIVGGVVGAIGGLLLAPRPGKDTREQLKKRADELMEEGRERYGDQYDRYKDMASDRGGDLKGRIDEVREKLISGVESATQTMKDKINVGTEQAQEAVVVEAEPQAEAVAVEDKTETQ
jgi:gas vesicle protein